MPKDLTRFKKKEPRTLLETVEANKVIDAINALRKLSVVPDGIGSFKVSDSECILDLSQLVDKINAASTDSTTDSGNGAGTSDQPITNNTGGTDLTSRITALENRISAASITAVCNSDGTITVTLKI